MLDFRCQVIRAMQRSLGRQAAEASQDLIPRSSLKQARARPKPESETLAMFRPSDDAGGFAEQILSGSKTLLSQAMAISNSDASVWTRSWVRVLTGIMAYFGSKVTRLNSLCHPGSVRDHRATI